MRYFFKRHAVVHTYKKTFKCEECDKCFTLKQNLTKHMLIHSGTKDFPYEVCLTKFTQTSNLKQHMLTHTEEKTHECEFYKRNFHRSKV